MADDALDRPAPLGSCAACGQRRYHWAGCPNARPDTLIPTSLPQNASVSPISAGGGLGNPVPGKRPQRV